MGFGQPWQLAAGLEFIHQPFGLTRLGDFLAAHLADTQWNAFRAAVAFAKRSGTQHIRNALHQFANRPGNTVRMSVGIDSQGTSKEALQDLVSCLPNGEIWVFHNPSSTFHPKVYLFRNSFAADVILGSGNLTAGGLFENYEALFAVQLQLNDQNDATLLAAVESALDMWSSPIQGICYLLNPALLQKMADSGCVRTEAQIADAHQAASQQAPSSGVPLFLGVPVPSAPPPPIPVTPAIRLSPEASTQTPVPFRQPDIHAVQVGGVTSHAITLQLSDVGFGQTTAGTSQRNQSWYFAESGMIFFVTVDQNDGCSKRSFDATDGRFLGLVERGEPRSECAAQRFGSDIASARFLCSLRGQRRQPLVEAEKDGLPNRFLVELRRLAGLLA